MRTDSPVSQLYIYRDMECIAEKSWESGRTLARDLLSEITELCKGASISINELDGVLCYQGPGSFTGLRIGITVCNTVAYAGNLPIVGETGENWLDLGLAKLTSGHTDEIIAPAYGSEPHITL